MSDDREWLTSHEWARREGVVPSSIRSRCFNGTMDRKEHPHRPGVFLYAKAAAPVEREPQRLYDFDDEKTDPERPALRRPSDEATLGEQIFGYRSDAYLPEDDAEYRTGLEPLEPVEPLEDLLERRTSTFERERRADRRRKAIIRIERDGPFAVCHLGDPHVDDDGCDWPELRRDVETIQRTEHMYAGNVGDTVNNWVGRLIGKWKQQSTTESEAFRLARWLFEAVEWDYILLGNHDLWNQGGTIFHEIAAKSTIRAFADHEARIEYVGSGGGRFRVDVRHDFKGHSMWNNQHGLMRRAKMRPWADLYVCGHKHTWGVHAEEAQPGWPVWTARVRGYKRMDEYAEAKDFAEDQFGLSITTVIDPDHPHPAERLKSFHDVEEGADYLAWVRKKR